MKMDHNGRLNQMFALSDPSSCFAARRFDFSRTTSVTLVASHPENFEYHCRQGFRRGRCHPMQLHRYSNDLFCAGKGQKMAKTYISKRERLNVLRSTGGQALVSAQLLVHLGLKSSRPNLNLSTLKFSTVTAPSLANQCKSCKITLHPVLPTCLGTPLKLEMSGSCTFTSCIKFLMFLLRGMILAGLEAQIGAIRVWNRGTVEPVKNEGTPLALVRPLRTKLPFHQSSSCSMLLRDSLMYSWPC